MIAGPNGSGKSTLIALLQNQNVKLGAYFNADDLARAEVERRSADLASLPEDKQAAFLAELWEQSSARAQIEVRQLREDALLASQDYAFETVMSHPSHIEHLLGARQAGFSTRLFFVCTADPNINVGRVANRVLHGGHDVPTDRVVDRYARCLNLLPQAVMASDEVLIYDNSVRDRPLRLLAMISGGMLRHGEVKSSMLRYEMDPNDLPMWWRGVLIRIKPKTPFADGRLA